MKLSKLGAVLFSGMFMSAIVAADSSTLLSTPSPTPTPTMSAFPPLDVSGFGQAPTRDAAMTSATNDALNNGSAYKYKCESNGGSMSYFISSSNTSYDAVLGGGPTWTANVTLTLTCNFGLVPPTE